MGDDQVAGLRVDRLEATAQRSDVPESQLSNGMALEVMAALTGLYEQHLEAWREHRERKSRKPRSRPEVGDSTTRWKGWNGPIERCGVQNQSSSDCLCVAVAGEVHPACPGSYQL